MNIQIQSLDISNFQRLSKAAIEPSGSLIVLAGKNANGKTSVLDAIQSTWCGHNSREIKRPIKDGHGKASIDIKMTDGTVLTRKYTPSGTTLTAKGPDGSKLGQKDLDRMMSALGVDAAAFINAGEKKQLETLLSIVDLPFVPAELDAKRKRFFDERTGVKRDLGQLEAQIKAYPAPAANLPDAEVSVSELIAQHRDGQLLNLKIERAESAVQEWQAKVNELTAQLVEAQNALDEASNYSAEAPALIDLDAIQSQIDMAEETNAAVRAEFQRKATETNLIATRREAEELTSKLEAIDKTKADGLAAAEMPVEGLSFDEEGVLYQGVPFSRASGAEQIIVSAAMIIATNPEMRTIVIRNGNVLDTHSLKTLEEILTANDFQAFIEFVSDGEDHEFRIVDGELAA